MDFLFTVRLGNRKKICKTVLVNSGLLFANYACACSTAVLDPVVQTLDSTIQRMSITEINYAIRWIVIHPVDSAIQLSNNLGLKDSFSNPFSNFPM